MARAACYDAHNCMCTVVHVCREGCSTVNGQAVEDALCPNADVPVRRRKPLGHCEKWEVD